MGEVSTSALVQAALTRVESLLREDLGLFRSLSGLNRFVRDYLYTIQGLTPDAEEKQETDELVKFWITDARYIANRFLTWSGSWRIEALERKLESQREFKNKIRDFCSSVDPLFYDSRFAEEAREMSQKLHEIAEKGLELGLKMTRKRPRDEAYPHAIQSDAREREEDREWLVEHLLRK